YKRPPRPLLVLAPWERAAPRSGSRCVLRTQWNTDRCTVIQSVITTCEICE
ncbi:unnamed protein product, partial [Staurois parvus]